MPNALVQLRSCRSEAEAGPSAGTDGWASLDEFVAKMSRHKEQPRQLATLKQRNVEILRDRLARNNLSQVSNEIAMGDGISCTRTDASSNQRCKYFSKTKGATKMLPPVKSDAYRYLDRDAIFLKRAVPSTGWIGSNSARPLFSNVSQYVPILFVRDLFGSIENAIREINFRAV